MYVLLKGYLIIYHKSNNVITGRAAEYCHAQELFSTHRQQVENEQGQFDFENAKIFIVDFNSAGATYKDGCVQLSATTVDNSNNFNMYAHPFRLANIAFWRFFEKFGSFSRILSIFGGFLGRKRINP